MPTFQELITQLTQFWIDQGCIFEQGYDLEVGAGTFNPSTFFRSLGPEPYSTVYVEPSRRPQDGRYGENPNRTHLFHQMQVLIKPSPANIQDLYLQSLQAIGVDTSKHDIRFVHDDWESPTLGAWGLGWEVWLDGMEITQFTYFQAMAGQPLDPIPVELTYGLERIAMGLQSCDNFYRLKWNDKLTYGELFQKNEVEWSHYHFTDASTDLWLRHFNEFEKEAEEVCKKDLPIPAYHFVMKASHAFNILEARGVLSTTERTGYISRIRELARQCGDTYIAKRKKLHFPLMAHLPKKEDPAPLPDAPDGYRAGETADFLLEIGSEELPATFVPVGRQSLERTLTKLLKDEDLAFTKVTTFGTPRRLSILVKDLLEGTPEVTLEKKGPPESIAFDSSGDLTQQGLGFLKSLGFEGMNDQITRKDGYLYATVTEPGKSTAAILSDKLPSLIEGLYFPKKMRWGQLEIEYARPLHWIVALHGKKIVPFRVGNITSDRQSMGHSQHNKKPFPIKAAADYVATLKKFKIYVDVLERKLHIAKQLEELEIDLGVQALETTRVLKEVLHLAEWPELTIGTFDKKFLTAPKEVLISEMVEHQRYFPLADRNGKLVNQFIITADNYPNDLIVEGNQKVLSARLSDGVFLYEQDLKVSLTEQNEKLKSVVLHKELGSMYDKVDRLKSLSLTLCDLLDGDKEKVIQAATFAKADLASELVGEFPNLQGVIGKHYALHEGMDEEAALAIEEHWLPKAEGGDLPTTLTGVILALADKIDNLVCYFRVGLKPTSSSDPYALRRQTLGLVRILVDHAISLDLSQFFNEEVLAFVTARAKTVFEDHGFKKDEIEASLQGSCTNPYDQSARLHALHNFRKAPHFKELLEVYKRARGQLESNEAQQINESLLAEPSEQDLNTYLNELEPTWQGAMEEKNYVEAFTSLASLQAPLARLFDEVKIMADDPKVRSNRIALLQKVFSHFGKLLDFSKLQ